MDKIYKAGDSVMPPSNSASPDQDDAEEQLLIAQARELSLDHIGLSTPSTHQTRLPHQVRSPSPTDESNAQHRHSRQADMLSHQSSLRSLLSQSDVDSSHIEQDIMQYILEHNLLDGMDINNLTPAQEDMITDSIARAFRSRRHRRARPHHHSPASATPHDSPHPSGPRYPPASSRDSRTTQHHRVRASSPSTRRRATSASHTHRGNHTSSRSQHLVPDSPTRPSNHSSPSLPVPAERAPSSPNVRASSVICSRCQTPDIQYSLHYNCAKCSEGTFNLCLKCFRAGKGCLNWFGFGHAALARYQPPLATDSHRLDHDPPHILSSRRYSPDTQLLEQGLFCEGCFAFANDCYWHCDNCNEGAWGYCNACVQQGKHCIHPLASIAHKSQAPSQPQTSSRTSSSVKDLYPPPLSFPKSAFHFSVPSSSAPILPHISDPAQYAILALTSYCDICHYSIPRSHARFHCNVCNEGNYDICTSCYHSLVNTGKVSRENGPSGWRRCLRGHRMCVVGHEDREGGSKRIVVREMVGGWALKDESRAPQSTTQSSDQWRWKENDGTSASQPSKRSMSSTMLPPDGGVGMRAQAKWSYFPAEEVRDELSFPRNAIIGEVEDINGDWFWGVFAGKKGLFPGNYVRLIS